VPQLASASGGDVLSLLWLEALLFALVVGSLIAVRLPAPRTLAVFSAYMFAAATAFYFTNDWPYSANLVKIHVLCIGVPFVAWLLALLLFRRKQT
jgi:hypothetical protein